MTTGRYAGWQPANTQFTAIFSTISVIEDRRERRACVGGLPDAARAHGDVPGALVLRVNCDIRYAPTSTCGADRAQRQAFDDGDDGVILRLLRLRGSDRERCQADNEE